MKALYVTDLHGDERKYLKVFEVAKDTGAGLIINGGDMLPAWVKLGQLLYQNLDIGSADIYDFLKEQQPLLSLHGHIHESPDTANGRWINSIGRTSCIQPGQTELYEDKMVLVELDLDSEKYERIVISVE